MPKRIVSSLLLRSCPFSLKATSSPRFFQAEAESTSYSISCAERESKSGAAKHRARPSGRRQIRRSFFCSLALSLARGKKKNTKNNPHRQLRLGHSRLWLDSQSYSKGAPARQREWSASEMVVGMVLRGSQRAGFFFSSSFGSLSLAFKGQGVPRRGGGSPGRRGGRADAADLGDKGERGGRVSLAG